MADVTDTFYPGAAVIGYEAQWLIGQDDGSPETFVAVADIEAIEFGEMTYNVINKTHLRSPGRAHEKRLTIRDIGPFRMRGNLRLSHGSQSNAGGDGFTSGGLIALHRAGSERNMKISYEDPAVSPSTIARSRSPISFAIVGDGRLRGALGAQFPGPYKILWEPTLAGTVVSAIWRPPT